MRSKRIVDQGKIFFLFNVLESVISVWYAKSQNHNHKQKIWRMLIPYLRDRDVWETTIIISIGTNMTIINYQFHVLLSHLSLIFGTYV